MTHQLAEPIAAETSVELQMLTHRTFGGTFLEGLGLVNKFFKGADRLKTIEASLCSLESRNRIKDFADSLEGHWPPAIAALASEALQLPFKKNTC